MSIDTAQAKDSLFGNKKTKKAVVAKATPKKEPKKVESIPVEEPTPLVEAMDVEELLPVLVPLSIHDKEALDKIAKKVMLDRRKIKSKSKRQRITTNSIIRVMVKHFIMTHTNIELGAIMNEDELLKELLKNNIQ